MDKILSPILLSLKVSAVVTVFTVAAGIILARIFTKREFRFKNILEVMISIPMILPPSVTGYVLLLIIGRNGILGKPLYNFFKITLVFHWTAACIAGFVVSLPLMYQSCKAAFLEIDPVYEDAAMGLGANEIQTFFKVTLPLAFKGIMCGTILSYARAMGEFGATLMVAGNIPEKTQTIPLAIYFSIASGDFRSANILMAITLVFSFTVIYTINIQMKKGR